MSIPTPQSEYARKKTTAAAAVESIRDGSVLCVSIAASAPAALTKAAAERVRSGSLRDLHLIYQHSMKYMAESLIRPEILGRMDARNFFIAGPDRAVIKQGIAEGRKYLSYIPCNFSQIPRALTEFNHVDTFLVTVSPMDASGHFSLGVTCDYSSTVIRHADRVIVEVNKNMPRVFGDSLVHISEVHALVENDFPLPEIEERPQDPDSLAIGKIIAEKITDGATIQLGIGSLPNAVASFLTNRNDLGIHTELFTPAFVDLIRRGVINGRKKSLHPRKHVFTFALGDKAMYDFMNDNPAMEGYPSSYVNDIRIIAQHDNLVSVNTAVEIDLYGQVNGEFIAGHQYSGSGGQFDFVKGASFAKGGKSFIALKSAAKNGSISAIVPRVQMATDTRMDVEYIVTENGMVNLRGRSTRERALALISIAHPNFREELTKHAKSINLI